MNQKYDDTSKKKTILLVEDEAITALVTSKAVKSFGYDVITAGTAEDAVALAIASEKIALILMDINLGEGIDGTETARRILEKRNVPIVFLTSHSEKAYVDRVKEITRYGYVVKNSGNFVLQSSIEMAFELFDAHEKKSESEKLYSSLVSTMIQGLALHEIVRDDQGMPIDYRFIMTNHSFSKITGLKEESYFGKTLFQCIPEIDKYLKEQFMHVAVTSEPVFFEYNAKVLGKCFEISLFAPSKNLLASIVTDTSERKKMEEALQVKVQELEAANEEFEAMNQELKALNQEITAINKEQEESNRELKAAEERLRKSEEKFRKAFMGSPDSISITRLSDGKFISVNRGFTDITGYSEEDTVGKSSLEINIWKDPEDRRKIVEGLKATGEVRDYEARFLTKHGEIVGSMSASIIELNGVQHILHITREITDRKRMEEELFKSHQCLTTILDSLDSTVYVVDFQSYEILFINKHGRDLWGNVQGKTCWKTLQKGQSQPCSFCTNDKLLTNTGEPTGVYSWEFQNTINGRWYECKDQVIPWVGHNLVRMEISADITAQKKLETELQVKSENLEVINEELGAMNEELKVANEELETTNQKLLNVQDALRESEMRLNFAVEGTNAGVWDWDIQKDQVVFSPKWKQMLGYEDQEVENSFSGWKKLWHPDDSDLIIKSVEDYLNGKTSEYEVIHRLRHKDGNWRWILCRGKILKDINGKPYRWVGTNLDISALKNAEERIQGLLAEKELLLKEVHHRIKNNMSAIRSMLILQADTLKDSSAREALNDAENRVLSMMVLYDKLYQSGNFKAISAKEYFPALIDEVIGNFAIRSTITVRKNIDDFMIRAKALSSLGMIINELLTNAMKHAFKGRDHGVIVVSASKKDTRATLTIEDDGVGIQEWVNMENSCGFGLHLVEMLAKQLKGTIRYERIQGTRFVLEFEV